MTRAARAGFDRIAIATSRDNCAAAPPRHASRSRAPPIDAGCGKAKRTIRRRVGG